MRVASRRRVAPLFTLAGVVAAVVLGCGSAVPSATSPLTASPTATRWPWGTPRPTDRCGTLASRQRDSGQEAPLPATSSTVVRWFVGLGEGTQPSQIQAEKAFVKAYNSSCSKWYVNLEIVPNDKAYDILKTEIAAGNAPDIIGPVGFRGRNGFGGEFLDLTKWVSEFGPDLGRYEPAVVDFLRDPRDGLVGLPYTIYPGYIFYNKDLFAAAGLPDLPHKVGELYQGRPWTWDNLESVAEQLTLDKNGTRANLSGFDSNNVVQYGFGFEWADARRIASCFGGGSFVAADGRTAQIPSAWADAWKWYYEAMWTSHVAPHASNIEPWYAPWRLGTGRIAMEASWPWAIDMYGTVRANPIMLGSRRSGAIPAEATTAAAGRVEHWDIAVMPSYGGQTSSPMDADTFVIYKGTSHPDEAYRVMIDIMADPTLMAIYGGLPARKSFQAGYFAALDAKLADVFPGNKVDWSVVSEMSKYPAVPSHEADMPNFVKAINLSQAFQSKLESQPGLDYQVELDKLKAQLQKAFDQTAASPSP